MLGRIKVDSFNLDRPSDVRRYEEILNNENIVILLKDRNFVQGIGSVIVSVEYVDEGFDEDEEDQE